MVKYKENWEISFKTTMRTYQMTVDDISAYMIKMKKALTTNN